MQGRASRFLTLVVAIGLATPCAGAAAHAQDITSDTVVAVSDQATAPQTSAARAVPAAAHRAPADFTLDAPPAGEAEGLMQQRRMGQPRAMMIVGASAFLAGAIIGGTAGTVLMVGGAIVGLVGLYDYLN